MSVIKPGGDRVRLRTIVFALLIAATAFQSDPLYSTIKEIMNELVEMHGEPDPAIKDSSNAEFPLLGGDPPF